MTAIQIGGKLRRIRQERRLTQAQMASELGISPSYINLIERNQRPVTAQLWVDYESLGESGFLGLPLAAAEPDTAEAEIAPGRAFRWNSFWSDCSEKAFMAWA